MLAMSLSYMALVIMRYDHSISTLLSSFSIISECWILSNVFLHYWGNLLIFILCFINVMLISLQVLNHPCIPGINLTWSWCKILLKYCWIQFAYIFWKYLHLCSSRILACNFLLFIFCRVWFGYRQYWLHIISLEMFLHFQFFTMVWEG